MNWEQIERHWDVLKTVAKTKWQDLTDSELEQIDGDLDQLVAKIQERYGLAKEQAELEVDCWRRGTQLPPGS